MTQSTKQTLNRLGVFTVSSFHAYVCARSPSLLNNLLAGRGVTKRRAPLLNARSNSAGANQPPSSAAQNNAGGNNSNTGGRRSAMNGTAPVLSPGDADKLVKVTLPDNQVKKTRLHKMNPSIFPPDDLFLPLSSFLRTIIINPQEREKSQGKKVTSSSFSPGSILSLLNGKFLSQNPQVCSKVVL